MGTGCVSKQLEADLQVGRESVVGQIAELDSQNRSGEKLSVDWKTAVKLLEDQNLGLQQGRARMEQLRKTRDEQWKNWVPRLGFYASLLSGLSELGTLGTSDLSASVVAPLNIPNPMTERAQAFANALAYLEGTASMELTYRRQVVALYRIFSRYESLLERQTAMEKELDREDTAAAGLGFLETRASQRELAQSLEANLAQILNLPGKSPVPVPGTRPDLGYEKRIAGLVPGKNYGLLAVRLSAYQIEAALLRQKGVELQQWPNVWSSATTPALYDTGPGESGGSFEADRISLFAGLSRSYDITGREADGIRTARENTDFVKKNLRLRLDQESREWIRLRNRYDQILLKQALAAERLQLLKERNRGSALADLTALRAGRDALASVEVAKEQLELEVWVWDDDKWR